MADPFSSEQTQTLQRILQLSLEIEKNHLDPQLLAALTELLLSFQNSPRADLQRLAEIPRHFSAGMTLRHFVNFMIPVERALDRQWTDADFLVETDTPTTKAPRRPIYFILDNLRSAFNVGSIFRLADSVGAMEMALCGYTPRPEQSQVKKTAMRADQFVAQKFFERAESAVSHYRSEGIKIIALETGKDSKNIFAAPMPSPVAFLLGNERFGLDHSLLSQVDEVRSIPMYGIKNSLNVGQAAAVAAFEWSRQHS